MSFLHCACTKSRLEDSPKSSLKPFAKDTAFTPLVGKSADERYMPSEMTGTGDYDNMIKFETDPAYYELYTVIGRACSDTATITLGKHIPSGTHLAICRTNLDICPIDFNILQAEVILNQQLQHERILPLLCSFVYNHEMWSVYPMMAFGSCFDLLHAHFTGGLQEAAIGYIVRDVLLALEYIHSRSIIHRSVRASHVLISANGGICLSGMRSAYCMIREGRRYRRVHDYPEHCVKSLQWFAPEILEQNLSGYDTKSDLYSVGILCCELANGCAPYTEISATQMLLEKVNGVKPVLFDSNTFPAELMEEVNQQPGIEDELAKRKTAAEFAYHRTFSKHFHHFVDNCLEKDPERRPSATNLLSHPFLKNLRKKSRDVLPELLHPVSPLTNIGDLPKCDVALEMATEQMGGLKLAEPWTF